MTVQRDAPVPRIAPIIQGEEPPSRSCVCWKCGQGYTGKGGLCLECESVYDAYRARVEMVHQSLHRKESSNCPITRFSDRFSERVIGISCQSEEYAYILARLRKKPPAYQRTS